MHFYTETTNGIEPRHFVTMKSDPTKTRPSRFSDAKAAEKMGEKWYSSVTTFLGVLEKPALSSWKIDQHLITAYEKISSLPQIPLDEYLEIIKAITESRLDAAPKAGTDCHELLEKYFRDGVIPDGEIERKICENVKRVLQEKCGDQNWEYEKYFIDKELGYAGCSDLVSSDWCIDYKSKQEAAKFKPGKMVYAEHLRQLAAYMKALGCKKAANIFICLENGEVDFHEHDEKALENGWLDFVACMGIFNRSK